MCKNDIIFVAHKGKNLFFDLSKSFGLTILLDNRMVNPFFFVLTPVNPASIGGSPEKDWGAVERA